MAYTPTLYRLTILASGSAFTPGQSANPAGTDFWVTTSRDPANQNYISGTPSDDGDKLDILTGTLDDAACQVAVSDASTYVTGWLATTQARFQLLGREAWVEKSTDGGTTYTTVRHGFVTDIELPRAQEYRITVGGARRRERQTTVPRILSGLVDPFNSPIFHPTAIIGGPIVGFSGLPGYQAPAALPIFEVMDSDTDGEFGWIGLRYLTGPLPPEFGQPLNLSPHFKAKTVAKIAAQGHTETLNAMSQPYFIHTGATQGIPGDQVFLEGEFRDVGLYLFNAVTPTTLEYGPLTVAGHVVDPTVVRWRWFMNPNQVMYAYWPEVNIGDPPPANGTRYAIAAVPQVMSRDYPTYYNGHPLHIVDAALACIGAPGINGTSMTAALLALGLELYHVGVLADPAQTVQGWIDQIGSFFGFVLALNADSTEYRVVLTRDRPDGTARPSFDDDALRAIGGPTFTLSASSKRTAIRATVQQFVPWNIEMDVERPYSDLVAFETPLEPTYEESDAGDAAGQQIIELTLPGTVLAKSPLDNTPPAPYSLTDFVDAIAERLFDRHGRGTPEYQFLLTGTTSLGVVLGGLADIDTSHVPNAQAGGAVRGGLRPGRLVALTSEPAGDVLTLIDEGTGVQYAGTFDFDSITASSVPGIIHVAISGAAALEADGARIDIHLGIKPAGTTTPPTGDGMLIYSHTVGDDGGGLYHDDLGPLPLGGVIWWFRARAWVPGGSPSDWTAWWNLNGADPTAPPVAPTPTGDISALVVSDIGTDYAVLSWTNTNITEPIRVSYKLDTASAYTVALSGMPPGSVTYTIFGLVPATAYDFQVEMYAAVNGVAWTTLTASDTTDAGTPTLVLFTPLNPRAYSGTGTLLGSVGLIVQPVFNTVHEVEFEMTPETAVGSGVPDGWPSDVTPAVDSGTQYWPVTSATPGAFGSVDVFSLHNVANDGRLRYFRARARKGQSDGSFIYSGWTTVVSVMPWIVFVPLPPPGAGSVVDGGTAYVTGPNQVDGGSDVANNTYSGPPLEGGSA